MDDILNECKGKMEKTIVSLKESLNTLRTGRANAALLDGLMCDYYGDKMYVKDIAAIKVPEPRQLLVIPFDQNDIKSIVAAINSSDIGINPIVDGKQIRLNMPALTEDRRKELSKKAKTYGEESKVSIRNVRRDAMEAVKKDDSYTEDTRKKEEAEIQKLTDEFVAKIDEEVKAKDKEIMTL